MASPTDLTTYLDLARTAISNGDASSARINIALAKTVLAELPSVTADGTTVSYTRSIEALESALADMVATSGGGGFDSLTPEFG